MTGSQERDSGLHCDMCPHKGATTLALRCTLLGSQKVNIECFSSNSHVIGVENVPSRLLGDKTGAVSFCSSLTFVSLPEG